MSPEGKWAIVDALRLFEVTVFFEHSFFFSGFFLGFPFILKPFRKLLHIEFVSRTLLVGDDGTFFASPLYVF